MSRSSARRTLLFLICAAFAFSPAAQARFQPTPCNNPYTQPQEIQLGYKAMAQVYQQQPILPDSNPVAQYVRSLGARLVQFAPGYRWPFQFHVVNAADINAFALPGGAIFINLGTIQAATDEAQLAGVMAHEISHVIQRHSTCNMARQQVPSILAGIGGALAGILLPGTAGAIAQQGISSVAGLTFLRMSRDDEKQADLMGTDILYDAGYDPRALPQFFETIQAKYGSGGAQLLSDHPNPGNRVGYVNQEIATLPPKTDPITNSPQFVAIHSDAIKLHADTADEIKAGAWKKSQPALPPEVAAVVAGTATSAPASTSGATPAAGTTTAGPSSTQPAALDPNLSWQPDSSLSTFNHSLYTLRYPRNWTVTGDAQSAVTIAPPGGSGTSANGQSATAYGILIDRYQGQGSLQQQTDALIQNIEQGNPGMAAVTDTTSLTVSHQHALQIEFLGSSPFATAASPMPERDWLITVHRPDGSLSYLVFIAPEKNFNALRPTFKRILSTFALR